MNVYSKSTLEDAPFTVGYLRLVLSHMWALHILVPVSSWWSISTKCTVCPLPPVHLLKGMHTFLLKDIHKPALIGWFKATALKKPHALRPTTINVFTLIASYIPSLLCSFYVLWGFLLCLMILFEVANWDLQMSHVPGYPTFLPSWSGRCVKTR